MAGPRDPARSEPAGPVGVAVRLVQRAHRIARQPRRGRAVRPAGHLSELLLRNPAAALRRGRIRLSGGRPDRRRRHQRQDHSPVGRGRAVRRPLRRIDLPRAGSRPARRDADPPRALALTRGQASQGGVHPAGVAGPAQRRRHRVRRRGGRRIRPRDGAVRTGHQRGPTGDLGRPAGVGHPGQPAGGRRTRNHRARSTSHAPDPGQRADDGRRDGPRGRRSRTGRGHHRRAPRPGPDHRDLRAAPGTEAAHRQIPGVRLVESCAPARRCATRPPPHCTAPATAGGRGCWTRNGPTSTTSGTAQTSRSRATPNPSRRCGSGCFTWCRPAPAPNAGRSPARGSPEPATTATPSGTPRVTCCRCSPTPRRMRSPTRCGGGRRHLDLAKERAAELGLEGASFPWRTIRGQECSAYWPAGTAAWHINADIAMAFERYRIVTGDHSLEEECGLEVLHRDRPAVDVARAPRPARRLAPRRGHRSRRVHGDRPRQRLHESDGGTQPAHRRRRLRPPPRGGRSDGRHHRGDGRLARRGRRRQHSLRRRAGRPSAVRRLHHLCGVGLRGQQHLPAAAARGLRAALPRAGDQAGRPGAGDAVAEPRVHRPNRRRATSTTTSGAWCATRRCRPAPRR